MSSESKGTSDDPQLLGRADCSVIESVAQGRPPGDRLEDLWRGSKNAFAAQEFVFSTSGSTGEAKTVLKSGSDLLKEAEILASLYDLSADTRICTWVSHQHIYGFLHGVVLPLVTGLNFIESNPFTPQGEQDFIVLVPSQWNFYFHNALSACWGRGFVSSTFPFGPARKLQLQSQRQRNAPRNPFAAWEILGSTETGGLASRKLLEEEDSFELLAGVQIDREARKVTSPWCDNVTLDDVLEWADESHFLHLGRADRVFKWAGHRHSLAALEQTLQIFDGQEWVCLFETSAQHPKGGEIVAICEGFRKSRKDLEQWWTMAAGNLPRPSQLIQFPQIPRDEKGKILYAEVEKLLKATHGMKWRAQCDASETGAVPATP